MSGADEQLALDLVAASRGDERPASPAADGGLRGEQRAVVRFDGDLVVNAGAGSGKTRTLVALYRTILANPALVGLDEEEIGPSRILCLTFTERAARELAERVRASVADPRWRRELETWPPTTFHAWCADLLRRHPLEAGVDPAFSVLSEDAADDLLRRSAVDALRHGLVTGDEAARRATELLGLGRAADALAALVRGLRTAGREARWPIERFERRLEEAGARLDSLGAEVERVAEAMLDAARAASLRTEGQRDALETCQTALAAWRARRTSGTALALGAAARSAGSNWRFEGHTEARAAVVDLAGRWGALALEVENRLETGIWPAMAVTVREAYRAARGARNALDFDDLILRARDLLRSRDGVRDAIRRQRRAILVDEHQDTDPVQHELLRLLIGEDADDGQGPDAPRWCVVGDSRQSIYGFRGATVAAFEELARDATRRGARRALVTNYRSAPELVAFHNAFFPAVLVAGERLDQVGYEPQEPFRDPGPGPAVEILDAADPPLPAAEARAAEARALAARLAAACAGGGRWAVTVRDDETGEERPARPGDVVVLFRRLTQVEPYRRALETAGLESIVVGSGSFYARQEVFDVLNALEAALHPNDPVALVGFLRSPMAGLPDDAIWALCRGWDRKRPLARHVEERRRTAGLAPREDDRLDGAFRVLAGVAARADAHPPGAIVGWLVDATGYEAVLDALPDRAQRRANLTRLLALADRAPSEGRALLSDWTAALRRKVEDPPRDRDAAPPEAGDRVRVMSIHQAKGQEFPVVALADVGGSGRGRSSGLALDPDLGIVAKVWGGPATEPVATEAYLRAKEGARAREEAEEWRLLYVAATRARDHLLLSAGTSGSAWLRQVRAFRDRPEAEGLVVALDFDAWRGRFTASLGQEPPLADPGVEVRPPLAAAPGEATAREAAAGLAGAPPAAPPAAAAREAAEAALRRGARGHEALERMPLAAGDGGPAAWLAGPGGLPPDEAAALGRYAAGEILPRLAGAAEVAREEPFRLHLPGGGVVAGTIDALWRDPDGAWWVGDYKFAEPGPVSDARHEAQLAVYALAAAADLGIDEVRGVLWYVDGDDARTFRWIADDLARIEDDLDAVFARLDRGPAGTAPPEEEEER